MNTVLKSSLHHLICDLPPHPDDTIEFPITEPPQILIVENDRQMAELIATFLRGNWFNCEVRCTGAQGVEAFTRSPVDLIITDLKMDAGDGVAMIQSIRRISQAPVIIITGFAAEYADRVRFLDNVALLSKPFDRQVLIDLVENALDAGNSGQVAGWNKLPPNTPSK
jgi:DNA-binding response OmpR family regulator